MENLQEFLKEIEELLNSVEDADLIVRKFSTTPPTYGYVVRETLTKDKDGVLTYYKSFPKDAPH
jgi:hypothetical protein